MLTIAVLSISGVVVFYTWFIFAPGYATTGVRRPAEPALLAGLLGQAVFLFAIPAGRCPVRPDRAPPLVFVYTTGLRHAGLPAGVDPGLPDRAPACSWPWLASLVLAVACAPLGAIFTELVPTRVRATVVGMTYGGFSARSSEARPRT